MEYRKEKPIWYRQKNETKKAYGYFCVFRDAGIERSLEYVCKVFKFSATYAYELAKKYSWYDRALAYDDYLEDLKLKKQEKAIEEMNERHIKIAMSLQEKIIQKLDKIDLEKLSNRDLINWFQIASQVERIARGSYSEKKKIDIETVNISEEKKKQLEEIFSKVSKNEN